MGRRLIAAFLLIILTVAAASVTMLLLTERNKPAIEYNTTKGGGEHSNTAKLPSPGKEGGRCYLNAENGTGFTIYLKRLGPGLCPSHWRYRVVAKPGYRVATVFLGDAPAPKEGVVLIYRNASLSVEARRMYYVLSIIVNYSAPYLVNGTKHKGSLDIVALRGGAFINITSLPLVAGRWSFVPINSSVQVVVSGNTTVRLYWRKVCRGVTVKSNVALPGLPACYEPPVRLNYSIEGPVINGTHRWWLGWYWVEEGGRRYWWSPGINGSTLVVKHPANVTAVYLPGLRDLPYVAKVPLWPGYYFNGSCKYSPGRPAERLEIRGGWVRAYDPLPCVFRVPQDVPNNMLWVPFLLPRGVRVAYVEIRVPKWRTWVNSYSSLDGIDVLFGEGWPPVVPEMQILCKGPAGDIRVAWDGLLNPYEGVGANGVELGYNGTPSFRMLEPKNCEYSMMPGLGFNYYGIKGTGPAARDTPIPWPRGGRTLLVRVWVTGGREAYFRIIGVAP